MIKKTSLWVLGTAALALTACGKKNADEAESAAAPAETHAEEVKITLPDAPENPLIKLNGEKSAAFLAENGARAGVVTTASGLQIEITKEGEGDSPDADDYVLFHYVGKLIDGTTFDDSHVLGSPIMVPSIEQLPVPGVPEALSMMTEGSTASIAVPPELAFGEEGLPGLFEPNTTLLFDLELIEVVKPDETERRAEIDEEQNRKMAEARAQAEADRQAAQAAMSQLAAENLSASQDYLADVATHEGVEVTESGLGYEVLVDGGDGSTPNPWDRVKVHYEGTLADGTVFDSSYARGEPIEFGLNQVIPGWTEGVGLMNVGDTYKFYIPPQLGYGERGTPGGPIGPNEALVFKVELLGITEGKSPDAE